MKYSWQKMQAPFLRPSMVDALMISSSSGMPVPFAVVPLVSPFIFVIFGRERMKTYLFVSENTKLQNEVVMISCF